MCFFFHSFSLFCLLSIKKIKSIDDDDDDDLLHLILKSSKAFVSLSLPWSFQKKKRKKQHSVQQRLRRQSQAREINDSQSKEKNIIWYTYYWIIIKAINFKIMTFVSNWITYNFFHFFVLFLSDLICAVF